MQAVIHLIDDDGALRESVAFLLRAADFEVKGFSSAQAFLASLPDASLSCVITDVRMQDLKVDIPVIVITGHGDVALAVEAMKLGATDFFEKPFNDDLLLASVRGALQEQAHHTKRHAERAEIEQRLARLSAREKDVLTGLIEGRANKQIAFDLGISPRTVEIYRANLMTKMRADSLSDLVRMALIVEMLGSS